MTKMRLFALLPAVILAAACGGSSSVTTSNNFGATLNGASEVPATTSTATGTATYTVSGSTVNYSVTYSGLSGPPGAAHIHAGAPGVAGGVVVGLKGLPTTASGTITGSFTQADFDAKSPIGTFADLLAQMQAGNTYTNIHTQANGGGEIRGQNAAR